MLISCTAPQRPASGNRTELGVSQVSAGSETTAGALGSERTAAQAPTAAPSSSAEGASSHLEPSSSAAMPRSTVSPAVPPQASATSSANSPRSWVPGPKPVTGSDEEDKRRVGDCVLPRSNGIPRKLHEWELGRRWTKKNWEIHDDIPELCLRGRLFKSHSEPHSSVVRYLVAGQSCSIQAHVNCREREAYAKALSHAWGVPYRKEKSSYRFVQERTEALLTSNRIGDLQLRITDVAGDAICTVQDGFDEFHEKFMRAVEAGDPKQVASFFGFPFKDQWRMKQLQVQSRKEFLARYSDFIADKKADSYPFLVPTDRVECRLDFDGYLDLGWQEGGMRATKRSGKWLWRDRAYVP